MAGLFDDLLPGAAPAGGGMFDDLVPKAPEKKPLPERSKLAAINDTVIDAANAVAGGVGSVADFVAPGNAVSKFIDENIVKPGQEKQSDRKKAINAQLAEDIKNADGLTGEAAAAVRYALADPAGVLAQAAGSFVVPAGAIKAGSMLAKFSGAGAKTASRVSMGGGAAAGAALSGGDAAGQAYEESLKAGATEEQAQAAARQASVIPAIVGGAGGMLGAERIFAGAKGFKGNAISRALKTGASEGAQEFGEEFATQYEANRAVAPYDGRDPMQGAVAAGTLGALAGAPIGMLTGAVAGDSPPAAAVPRVPPAAILRLGNSPDPYISFPDGTVGKRADVERYINSLPEASRAAARAKFMGLAPQKADPVAAILAADTVDTAINAARRAVGYNVPRIPVGAASYLEPDQTIIAPATPGRGRAPDEIARQGREEIAAQEEAIRRRFPPATGEATEILPTGDATELEPIPAADATEVVPTGEASEVEPIPAGDASEEIPAPDAYEVPPIGEATEVIPTGDAMEVPRIPTGKATEIEPEVVEPTDLTTTDGMPYGSKTAANVRARREGLGPANVIEIPGAGWVVRPQPKTMGPEPINAQPAGTRGTTAADILKAPDDANPARAAGPRPADAGRGDGAGVLPVVQPGDVAGGAAAPAEQGVAGGGAAGPGGRGGALTRYQEPNVKRIGDDWQGYNSREWKPDARQQVVMDAVAAALDSGLFYSKELKDRVATDLGVSDEVRAKNRSNVEGGDFGYDVYYARKAVEARRELQSLDRETERASFKAGDKLGVLVFSDYKSTKAVVVETVEDGLVTFTGKRGNVTVRGKANALQLKAAMDRAKERGNRLDDFDAFVAGRSKAAPPPAKQGPTAEGATDEGLQGQGQGRREEVAAGARAQAGAPAEGAGASRPTPAPAPASEAAAEPWKLTREQAAKDYPGDEYDRMLNRHGDLGDLSYTEVDRRARVNSLGQRKLWAKTRAQLEQEGKDAVKAARGDRAATNKLKSTPEFANWRLKAMSRKGKEAIADAERLAREYLAIHKDRVQEALMEGKDVPAEVLADYPDLKRPASDATPPAPAPTLAERVKQRREKAAEPAPRAPVNAANSKADAFSAMVDDGDLQAALDYAKAVGIDPKTAKLSDVLRKRLDKFMRDEEMAAAVAARVPAAPAPAPQPEVDAAPAAEPAAEAPALPNPWEISQDEFVRRVTFTKEGSSAFPWVAKWGDRILEAENEVFDHPDLGKTVVQGGRFSKTKREAEVVARGAHKRAVRRGVLNGNKATTEALSAYPDLLPAEAPAAERYEAGRALTKEQRKQVLASLVDVYKAKGADREQKGIGRDGNERYGYVHSPELFEKSDITGAMVRYYVTLPDGRRAHPTELFPDYTLSDIEAEMQRRDAAERNDAAEQKRVEDRLKDVAATTPAEARAEFDKRNPGTGFGWNAPKDRTYLPYTKDGKFYTVMSDDVALQARLKRAGWMPADQSLAPARDEPKIELRKRLSVLRSLKDCLA